MWKINLSVCLCQYMCALKLIEKICILSVKKVLYVRNEENMLQF